MDTWGADLAYLDPFVPVVEELGGVRSVELTEAVVAESDAVVVVVAHGRVDYEVVAYQGNLVLDTRNILCRFPLQISRL
ncbi:hypothetical protein [Persicimonas caeni]|uniref:hypothetical protein n=1 Tax=Persicimonas caeni TaxID=2292766 RepID=UPI0036F1C08E